MPSALLLLASCSGSRDSDGGRSRDEPCPIGDMALPVDLQIVHQADGQAVRTASAAELPLIVPPQGGWILLIGARARNLDCEIDLTVSLRDPCDGAIVALEQRPATLSTTLDGWGEPAFPAHPTHYGNVPVCPQSAARRDLEGEPYTLRVAVEDGNGRKGEASLPITPVCRPEAEDCLCQCDRDFVLGEACTQSDDPLVPPLECPERDAGM